MMLTLIVASGASSKRWKHGWRMHFPVRRRRPSWPMMLSLQVPPELSSASLRGSAWSAKRRRHGSSHKPPLTLFSTVSLDRAPMDVSATSTSISGPDGLEGKDAMSAIQIVCAVAVPLLWGYQFVAIKVGVTEFPPLFFLALRFLAIALLLVPFVERPTRRQFGPIAAISLFLGGLNFGLFYVGLGLGSGSMSAVAYQLATPLRRPVSLAASRGEAVSHDVRRSRACIPRRGRVGGGAWPVGKRASAAACGRGSFRVRGLQRLDEALRSFRPFDVDGLVVAAHGAAGHVDVVVP